MHDWLSAHEVPDVCVEAAKLLLNFQETLGVIDSGDELW